MYVHTHIIISMHRYEPKSISITTSTTKNQNDGGRSFPFMNVFTCAHHIVRLLEHDRFWPLVIKPVLADWLSATTNVCVCYSTSSHGEMTASCHKHCNLERNKATAKERKLSIVSQSCFMKKRMIALFSQEEICVAIRKGLNSIQPTII